MEAREQMMLGCVITGFGFSNANLGLVHAIAHTLSAHFHLAHGMANAAVLPYVMEFNADGCPEKMAELARAIGLTMSGNMDGTLKSQYDGPDHGIDYHDETGKFTIAVGWHVDTSGNIVRD